MNVKLDMIGMTVKDIPTSVAFYRALGLEVPEPDGTPHHETVLEGGLRLAWDSEELIRELEPHWQPPVGQRMGLAFLCASPDEVNVRHAAMVAKGYASHKEPWDAFWGQRYAQTLDPDGNIVDLFCPL